MLVDDKLEYVKKYVENATGIDDISLKKKTNPYVFSRAVYYKICKKYVSVSYDRCARFVNKDHCSFIHALTNTYPSMPNQYIDIINDFNPDGMVHVEESDRDIYDQLLKSEAKVKQLKNRITELNVTINELKGNDYSAQLIDLLGELTFEQEINVKSRISAMITMEKKKLKYNRQPVKPL